MWNLCLAPYVVTRHFLWIKIQIWQFSDSQRSKKYERVHPKVQSTMDRWHVSHPMILSWWRSGSPIKDLCWISNYQTSIRSSLRLHHISFAIFLLNVTFMWNASGARRIYFLVAHEKLSMVALQLASENLCFDDVNMRLEDFFSSPHLIVITLFSPGTRKNQRPQL